MPLVPDPKTIAKVVKSVENLEKTAKVLTAGQKLAQLNNKEIKDLKKFSVELKKGVVEHHKIIQELKKTAEITNKSIQDMTKSTDAMNSGLAEVIKRIQKLEDKK